ncbi:hypothetical protein FISHEDRAFT_73830 [Fistulina hepatica ATCC 64428]|uniref:RRM domain-containing protein n=1 Tax=Fistulina hepatica ATCC 64428 TaxID=1128425 RepID=A0A0D7ABN9_9AGAR|nr:hypothetical protein FISHEDRAFT_73830 [Fistulina hepatica ATCC 64428]
MSLSRSTLRFLSTSAVRTAVTTAPSTNVVRVQPTALGAIPPLEQIKKSAEKYGTVRAVRMAPRTLPASALVEFDKPEEAQNAAKAFNDGDLKVKSRPVVASLASPQPLFVRESGSGLPGRVLHFQHYTGSAEELDKLFKPYKEHITRLAPVRNKSGALLGHGAIKFKSEDAAKRCMDELKDRLLIFYAPSTHGKRASKTCFVGARQYIVQETPLGEALPNPEVYFSLQGPSTARHFRMLLKPYLPKVVDLHVSTSPFRYSGVIRFTSKGAAADAMKGMQERQEKDRWLGKLKMSYALPPKQRQLIVETYRTWLGNGLLDSTYSAMVNKAKLASKAKLSKYLQAKASVSKTSSEPAQEESATKPEAAAA